jgi:hypothetical protein
MIPKTPHDLRVELLKAAIDTLSIPPGIYDKPHGIHHSSFRAALLSGWLFAR